MKSFLVTGAAGFIGSHVCELLIKKRCKVIGIDNLTGGRLSNLNHLIKNKNFSFLKIDILKIKKLKNFLNDFDYVIHLAGIGDIVPSIEQPKKYLMNNVIGTVNLLELIRGKKIKKFVYAASSSCYGIARTPTKETAKIDPKYPYALSKYLGEVVCMHWGNLYNIPVNSIRIFNAYGTRSRTSGAYGAVMGVFLKQIIAKKPLTIVGNGKQKRDFLYASDVALAFYKACTTKHKGKIWNIGSDNPKSIKELVKILEYKKNIKIPKRPGEPKITFADTKKIKKDLKWKPKVTFKKGIKIILKNIEYWKNAPLWTPKKIEKKTKLWHKYVK